MFKVPCLMMLVTKTTPSLLSGAPPQQALQLSTASVFELLSKAFKRGADELMLETDQASLSRPMAMVQLRQLGPASSPPRRS